MLRKSFDLVGRIAMIGFILSSSATAFLMVKGYAIKNETNTDEIGSIHYFSNSLFKETERYVYIGDNCYEYAGYTSKLMPMIRYKNAWEGFRSSSVLTNSKDKYDIGISLKQKDTFYFEMPNNRGGL